MYMPIGRGLESGRTLASPSSPHGNEEMKCVTHLDADGIFVEGGNSCRPRGFVPIERLPLSLEIELGCYERRRSRSKVESELNDVS